MAQTHKEEKHSKYGNCFSFFCALLRKTFVQKQILTITLVAIVTYYL